MTDRISYDQLTALVNARADQAAQRVLYTALTGINTSEDTIRARISMLRGTLDDIQARLDAGLHADAGIQHAVTDLDRAVAARQMHWATAAALLTEAELAGLGVTR